MENCCLATRRIKRHTKQRRDGISVYDLKSWLYSITYSGNLTMVLLTLGHLHFMAKIKLKWTLIYFAQGHHTLRWPTTFMDGDSLVEKRKVGAIARKPELTSQVLPLLGSGKNQTTLEYRAQGFCSINWI